MKKQPITFKIQVAHRRQMRAIDHDMAFHNRMHHIQARIHYLVREINK